MTRRVADEMAAAVTTLTDAGVASPRADAEWLLAAVLGVDRGRLLVADDLDDDTAARYRAAVARRATREPLQHITGTAAFGSVDLAVGPGVFVPRPETELLLQWALDRIETTAPSTRIADLCSGSGALAIALADAVPGADVYAVENSAAALEWLRRNAADARRADGTDPSAIEVVAADVTDLAAMTAAIPPGSIDIVVSNPPYVPVAAPVDPEVRADPSVAVFGGDDGLSVIAPMVPVIARLLRPGGWVGIEHDDTTADLVIGLLARSGTFADVTPHTDLAGRPRFVTARRHTDAADRDTTATV
ncbi:peptide chain release factor N(5)-glutamine methyltransferase [Gordonia sinesedis]